MDTSAFSGGSTTRNRRQSSKSYSCSPPTLAFRRPAVVSRRRTRPLGNAVLYSRARPSRAVLTDTVPGVLTLGCGRTAARKPRRHHLKVERRPHRIVIQRDIMRRAGRRRREYNPCRPQPLPLSLKSADRRNASLYGVEELRSGATSHPPAHSDRHRPSAAGDNHGAAGSVVISRTRRTSTSRNSSDSKNASASASNR